MPTSVSRLKEQFDELNPSDDNYRLLLRELLIHQDLRLYVEGLHGSSLEEFVGLLDEVRKVDIGIHWC